MEKSLRLLIDIPREGDMNMALDEAIALGGIPTLRFYTWARPWVTIGYFQKSSELDWQYLASHNLSFVRRLTGGKGVYHHRELTYSLIIPEEQLPSKVIESYGIIGRGLLLGLGKLGIQAELEAFPGRTGVNPNCFAGSGWYEVKVGGKKLVGSAQLRRRGMIIQQGSILISGGGEILCFKRREVPSPGRATSIEKELGRVPSFGELTAAFQEGFAQVLPLQITPGSLEEEELALGEGLRNEKYSTEEWNLRR